MAKILSVFHGIPSTSADNKHVLTYNLCKVLKDLGNEVHIAILVPRNDEGDLEQIKRDGFTVYHVFEGEGDPAGWGQWAVNSAMSTLTMSVYRAFKMSSGFSRFLRELVGENRYRMVQFSDWGFYRAAAGLGSRRLLIMPSIDSLYYERLMEATDNPISQLSRSLYYSQRKKGEMTALQHFDNIAVFCNYDANFIAQKRMKRPITLPVVYPNPGGKSASLSSRTIAFPYNGSRAESMQNSRWFHKYIFPEVVRAIGEVKLIVGGDVPRSRQAEIVGAKVSFVADISTALDNAAVAILPTFASSGVRAEVIEALWRGIPVVASPIALEGFGTELPGLVPKLYKDDFANGIIEILSSAQEYETLSAATKEYAEKTFGSGIARDEIEKIYGKLLA